MMADEFKVFWSEIQNYIAEADADLIPVPGQFELHGRCRNGSLAVSIVWCSLFVADLIVGMEESDSQYNAEADVISEKLE